MSELTIQTLKEIVEKLPDDYIVKFRNTNGSIVTISDTISVEYLKRN